MTKEKLSVGDTVFIEYTDEYDGKHYIQTEVISVLDKIIKVKEIVSGHGNLIFSKNIYGAFVGVYCSGYLIFDPDDVAWILSSYNDRAVFAERSYRERGL